jgi:hypothetical protein
LRSTVSQGAPANKDFSSAFTAAQKVRLVVSRLFLPVSHGESSELRARWDFFDWLSHPQPVKGIS